MPEILFDAHPNAIRLTIAEADGTQGEIDLTYLAATLATESLNQGLLAGYAKGQERGTTLGELQADNDIEFTLDNQPLDTEYVLELIAAAVVERLRVCVTPATDAPDAPDATDAPAAEE